MRTFLIFIFVAVVSLFVYNPELDDFKSYMDKSLQETAQREQTSFSERMFNADTTTAEQPAAGYSTERNNFLFFSTYRVVETDDFRETEIGRYLGIATMFFELGKSDIASAHAAQP